MMHASRTVAISFFPRSSIAHTKASAWLKRYSIFEFFKLFHSDPQRFSRIAIAVSQQALKQFLTSLI